MLKDLFDKGKCALGFHVGDWRYLQDGSCQQTRICSRCQVSSQQLVHPWQTWDYETPDSCRMARRCGRCAETETKVEHVWASLSMHPSTRASWFARGRAARRQRLPATLTFGNPGVTRRQIIARNSWPARAALSPEPKDAQSTIGVPGIPAMRRPCACAIAARRWFSSPTLANRKLRSSR